MFTDYLQMLGMAPPAPAPQPIGPQPATAMDTVMAAIQQPEPMAPEAIAPEQGLPPEIADAVGMAPAPAPQQPQRTKEAVSGSFSGVTDEGLQRAGKHYSKVDQKTDAFMAPVAAQTQQNAARYGAANEQAQTAVDEAAQVSQMHYERERQLFERQAEFEELFSAVQRKNHEIAKVEREQYIGAYKEQLAGVNALIKQSGNPLGGLGAMEGIGLGFAYFAQGFLGAQGIKIDVAGQVDNWVNRSIQEHQMKIQNARDAAGQTLNLYEIARQTSQDDAEAYDRYRGFVIEGIKTSIQANASRFGSDLAMSKAKEQSAALDMQLAETMERLGNNFFQQRLATRGQFAQEAYNQGQLANQRADLAFRKEVHADQKKAAEAKAAAETKARRVYDPANTVVNGQQTGGRVIGDLRPDAKEADIKAVNEAMSAREKISRGIDELKKLRSQVTSEGGPEMFKQRFGDEAWQRWDNRRGLLVGDITKAMSGLTVNAAEAARYEKLLRDTAWFQANSNGFQLDDVNEWSRVNFESTVRPWLDEGSVEQYKAKPDYVPGFSTDPAGQTERNLRENPGTRIESPVSVVAAGVQNSDANDATGTVPSEAYQKYSGKNEDTWGAENVDKLVMIAVDGNNARTVIEGLPQVNRDLIDKNRGLIDENGNFDATKMQNDAKEALLTLAHENKGGWSGYAQHMLSLLQTDPKEAYRQVTSRNTSTKLKTTTAREESDWGGGGF